MGTSNTALENLAEEMEPEGTDTPEVVPTEKPVEPVVPEPEVKDEPVSEETVAETPATPAAPDPLLSVDEQNRELRQILRQQRRDMAVMQAKLSRVEKRSAAATKDADEEVDDIFASAAVKQAKDPVQEEEVSPIEAVQQQLSVIARTKGPVLDTLLEVMEVSPQYTDVRDVCSQANFNDIFEAIGDEAAGREGKDPVVAALEAEAAVWSMPNPYKFMYDLIKKHHPKYADRQPATPDTKVAPKPTGKKAAEVPQSIASVPGKGAPTNAWTAARIDEIPEEDLEQVPKDIYNKYLSGELD